jgi:hypothetical protein
LRHSNRWKSLPIDKLEFKKIKYDTPSDRRKLVKTRNEVRLNDKDMSFCEKLCVRLGNTNSVIFDILPDSFGKPSDKTEDVCSDLNVANYEEVSTSEIITFLYLKTISPDVPRFTFVCSIYN